MNTPEILLAGVDEVGRGPLAGPVVAAAVILDPQQPIAGLCDSKKLTAAARERLDQEIRSRSLAWAIGRAEVAEIDDINILQASLLAMRRAVLALPVAAAKALVDGNKAPQLPCPVQCIIKGDASVPVIGAASIIAKVYRDREMEELDAVYPGYEFSRHKGYPTALHLAKLQEHGVSPIHRRSFRPVAQLLQE